MVRHYCEWAERIMSKALTSQHRIDDYTGNISSFKVARTGSRGVEIAINPDEDLSARDFSRWRKPGDGRLPCRCQVIKSHLSLGAPMRQPSPRELHTEMVGENARTSSLKAYPWRSAEPSLGTADTSVCATIEERPAASSVAAGAGV